MSIFRFELLALPPEAEAFRDEVRAFIRAEMGDRPSVRRARSWGGYDPEFSRKLGARGWIGMTWPKRYGGHERSFFERYVLLEELLAAGAPAGAHWVAERQSGPLLLRFGTEAQRERFLPQIVRGELSFAIGMSEPDSGSDLASIRTRAEHDGRRLRRQRHQDVDQQRPPLPVRDRALPHRGRARQEARGALAVPGRPEVARHHDPADHQPGRLARLQRGHLPGRLRARRHAGRRGRRRLEAGDDRAGLRAERARALPLEHRAAWSS